jgi:nucleoside-diphosphate-sugar epimerase
MRLRHLTAFGCGYVARALAGELQRSGVDVEGTTRSPAGAAQLSDIGVSPVIWPGEDFEPAAGAWLISIPPDADGCPAARAFASLSGRAEWIGYLSTTGVYGDLGGRWAFEETPASPLSEESRRRLAAEEQWLAHGACVFRLPGIYGPGRSALERIRSGDARCIIKEGQIFSRAHRDDIVSALIAAMTRGVRSRIFNICDDCPSPPQDPLLYAARLLGTDAPPCIAFEEAELSPMARRFYGECKRVSNARAKAELGWRPAYPSYQEGLADCLSRASSST